MKITFPEDFIFGTSTAAAQIETAFDHDWQHLKARDGEVFERTTDHEQRLKEDAEIIASLAPSYRMSLMWSKLQRKPFDELQAAAVQEYHNFLQDLQSRNISIMMVLHHFTNPTWFAKVGSWEKEENIELVIGSLSEQNIENELIKLNLLHLRRRIRCIGYVPDFLLPIIYKQAEVFLYPSLHEGFGLPILEAMSCGTPVVTSTSTAMPEVAGDAAFLVNPYDVNDILRGIEEALIHNTLRSSKVTAGLQRVNQFSWDTSARQMQEIYQSIASL